MGIIFLEKEFFLAVGYSPTTMDIGDEYYEVVVEEQRLSAAGLGR